MFTSRPVNFLQRIQVADWGNGNFVYDVLGNIKNKNLGTQQLTYSYDTSKNRLQSVTGGYNFVYDDRGNVLHNGKRSFNFNRANQITTSGNVTYQYDGHGRRVKKSAGTTSYSVYNKAGQLMLTDGPQGITHYIYLGKELIAKTGSSAALEDKPGYTGHLEDRDIGLTYMQQRYYDSVLGRFYSNDPVGFSADKPMMFNRYAYANNNPYKFVDPDGRAVCANADCSKSTIGHEIKKGAQPLDSSLPGNPQADMALVTFENDVASGPSTDQPVSTETAVMIEAIIARSGVDSININSTSGGKHSKQSRHYSGKDVDINKVNGSKVKLSNKGAVAIQNAASEQSNIRENFGPASNEKTVKGETVDYTSRVGSDHRTHIHISGNN